MPLRSHTWWLFASVAAVREFVLGAGRLSHLYERVAADKPLRNDIKIGTVYPIFKGAAGKIFGAYLGDFKDTDMSASESAQIRHDGYVVTRGNRVPDAASIAVPIFSFGNSWRQ